MDKAVSIWTKWYYRFSNKPKDSKPSQGLQPWFETVSSSLCCCKILCCGKTGSWECNSKMVRDWAAQSKYCWTRTGNFGKWCLDTTRSDTSLSRLSREDLEICYTRQMTVPPQLRRSLELLPRSREFRRRIHLKRVAWIWKVLSHSLPWVSGVVPNTVWESPRYCEFAADTEKEYFANAINCGSSTKGTVTLRVVGGELGPVVVHLL